MLRATLIRPAGSWPPPPTDRVTLDYDGRRRRRAPLTADGGLAFLLDLPRPTTLSDGDGLELDDGRIVAVRAAPEPLAEARAGTPALLARCAYHLGNRHVPVEVTSDALRLRPDPVLLDLLARLGATVALIEAPFRPESGAYAAPHAHGT